MKQINIQISDDTHEKLTVLKDKFGLNNNSTAFEYFINFMYRHSKEMQPLRNQVKLVKDKITLADDVEVKKSK